MRLDIDLMIPLVLIYGWAKFQEEIQKLSAVKQPIDISAMTGAGGVIGFFVVCAYPIVSLILVKQAASKITLK